MPRFRVRRSRFGIAASAGLLAVVIASVCLLVVHLQLSSRTDDLERRSALYALTLAQELPPLIGVSAEPDLQPFGDYVSLSGLLFAQVVSNGSVLLDVRSERNGVELDIQPLAVVRLPRVVEARLSGRLLIDVAFPYGPVVTDDADSPPYGSGYLRIGVDAGELDRLARRLRFGVAAAGAALWVGLSLLATLLLRPSGPPAGEATGGGSETPPATPSGARRLVAGALTLDLDASRITKGAESVDLTPKQREVLRILFTQPGRVFTDAEILAELWKDSPYADSRDVKQLIYLTRQRLRSAGWPADEILANVPGSGYRIVGDLAAGELDSGFDARSIHTRYPSPDDRENHES
jgi:DNA-binding winged helix-turn-helix (wHTH) protein